jgi:X-Pro dipeptidyl-peptidase
MKRRAISLSVVLVAIVVCSLGQSAAASAPPSIVIGTDGETAPVFSYANAIRERVLIPVAGVDQDNDGVTDQVAADIIRPLETTTGLKVPAIIDASPYFTSLGRSSPTEYLHTGPGGAPDGFPLFYDNFFVPRGYAVILAQANGTGFSTGCPLHGGPGDIASMKAVVDWLRGRVQGFDANGDPVVADWHNGKAAMIGKSYDGTLANGVASTGVEGLTTIVPISAISDWYDYSRSNGVRHTVTHYPASLSTTITQNQSASLLGIVPPSRTALCAPTRTAMSAVDGDATGDINDFWSERDYNANVANVHAAVFASNGLNDDNVRPNQFSKWWYGLAANNVPRKLWLSQEGHVDPFDYRRAEWVDTLHRWFDYWLQDVPNGIMSEPRVTIETSTNIFEDAADWPLPSTADVDVFLRGTAAGAAGTFGLTSGGHTNSLTFTDLPTQSENAMIGTPTGSQANRLVFLSPVLSHDLHVSGTPTIDIQASFNKTSGNLGALLVDYSAITFSKASRGNDGVTFTGPSTCWGDSIATDDACYVGAVKPTTNVTSWRVSKGILDAQNRDSLLAPSPLVAGLSYEFSFPELPTDYMFPAGHQIGVILVSNYASYSEATNTTAPTAEVTVDTQLSKVVFPIVGGTAAAVASGAFTPDTTAPVLQLPGHVTLEATGPTTSVAYSATATDNVDASPAVSCTPASGSSFVLGTTTVHCTATDAGNNEATGAFDVTVVDTTPPALHLPAPITAGQTSPAGAAITYAATADDTVDANPGVSCLPASGSTFTVGTTTVHCTATDASTNTSNGAFNVTVTDTSPPVLHRLDPITREATGPTTAVTYSVSATDGTDPSPAVSCVPTSGSLFAVGTTIVRCVGTDSTGNSASGSFPVTITDTTPPVLHLPAPITAAATSPAGATVTFAASATDTADAHPTLSCLPASGSTFALGRTSVHCTATDAVGNVGSSALEVTVADTTPPVLQLPSPPPVEATGAGTPVIYSVTVTDQVDSNLVASCNQASGSTFAVGRTTVRCTATDASGNAATGSFLVTVTDTTRPVLRLPAPITVNATRPVGATIRYTASATDIADPHPGVACRLPSGSTFAAGNTTVRCTATDASGNTVSGSFVLHVKSASEQLRDLHTFVAGAGHGRSLENRVGTIRAKVAARKVNDACAALGAFTKEVRAQSGKSLTHAKAAAALADAARISTVLGC